MKRTWTLDELEVFCAVARLSSFSGAAKTLGVSPAYVTKRIGSLEAALGVTLFNRTTRRVRISDDGERAFVRAREVLEAAAGLLPGAAAAQDEPAGTLRIATSLRLGINHVAPVMSKMARRWPLLDLWLELLDRRVDLIGENFDIDIRVGEVSEPHLVARRIAHSARVLVAAPRYLAQRGTPRTLAEVAQHDCLVFRDRDQPFSALRMQGPQRTETVKVMSRMGSNLSAPALRWALDAHGLVLLSVWDVARDLRAGRLVRVLPEHTQPADVYAVMATRSSQSPKLQACLEFLQEHLASGPHALDTRLA